MPKDAPDIETFLGLSATAWTALAAIATMGAVLVAVAAAILALRQLSLARELNEDQARPYVIATFETSKGDRMAIDFVVKNIGATPARNLKIKFDKPYVRVNEIKNYEFTTARFLLETVSSLAPQAELRNFFDAKNELDAVGKIQLTVKVDLEYLDRRGRKISERFVLDPFSQFNSVAAEVFDIHDVAVTLRALAKHQGVRNF